MNGNELEEQLINRRLEELKQTQPNGVLSDTAKAVYAALAAEFPKEAMSTDKSRGFALTSIKAQYVTERLNDVLGFMNWTHGGEFQRVDEGVLYLGTLVVTVDGHRNQQFAPGFAKITDGKNLGDAYKSAKTDSLSKAASLIGVGNSVFKGLIDATTFVNKNASALTESSAPTTARAAKKASVEASEKTDATVTQLAPQPATFKTRRAKAAAAVSVTEDDGI